MNLLSISKAPLQCESAIQLPASKSESNRVLIISALAAFQQQQKVENSTFSHIGNLSEARDTLTLQKLLVSTEKVADVIDAGTAIRFLAAYFSVVNQEKILTGTDRMCQRPIGILVDALIELGAEINYMSEKGFPPLEIRGFTQKNNRVTIQSDISSQYISALLMVAPVLKDGLTLILQGKTSSTPYIHMTLEQMADFGIEYTWIGNEIHIPTQNYHTKPFSVESDWSAASYWFSMVAIAPDFKILLKGLKEKSLQGDKRIMALCEPFGVSAIFGMEGLFIEKKGKELPKKLALDFSDCPDLAQTMIVLAAASGVDLELKGLESLKIKETDRILALQNELKKTGVKLTALNEDTWFLESSKFKLDTHTVFSSYEDHRMAMAFAPLALLGKISIENPIVVAKSYPNFWKDLKRSGFEMGFYEI